MLVQPMLEYRPLLQTAFGGSEEELQKEIKDEEELERKGDRIYWEPLSKDLEQLERVRRDRIRGAMVTKLWSVRTYNPLLLLIMSIYKKKTRAREAQEKRTWRLHGK